MDKKWREFVMLVGLSIFAWFTVINFNERVGLIYGIGCVILLGAYYALYDSYPNKIIPIERDEGDRLKEILISIGAYVAFILVAGGVALWITPSTGTYLDTVNSLVGETFSATPVLFGSPVLKTIVWGIVIPIIETVLFFAVLIALLLSLTKYSITSDIKWNLLIIILVGSIIYTFAWVFMVFHSEAKGITNNPSLITTFIFGAISIMLVLWRKVSLSAIFLHVITNTIATMKLLTIGFYSTGIFTFNFTGVLILSILIGATWLILFFDIPFGNQIRRMIHS